MIIFTITDDVADMGHKEELLLLEPVKITHSIKPICFLANLQVNGPFGAKNLATAVKKRLMGTQIITISTAT